MLLHSLMTKRHHLRRHAQRPPPSLWRDMDPRQTFPRSVATMVAARDRAQVRTSMVFQRRVSQLLRLQHRVASEQDSTLPPFRSLVEIALSLECNWRHELNRYRR